MSDPAVRVVMSTAPDAAVAGTIVRTLVDEQIAACGNIVPGITSIYRWNGAVEEAGEVMILLKTTTSRVDALIDRLTMLHPYEVPEAIVLEVQTGLSSYLSWIHESTQGS